MNWRLGNGFSFYGRCGLSSGFGYGLGLHGNFFCNFRFRRNFDSSFHLRRNLDYRFSHRFRLNGGIRCNFGFRFGFNCGFLRRSLGNRLCWGIGVQCDHFNNFGGLRVGRGFVRRLFKLRRRL